MSKWPASYDMFAKRLLSRLGYRASDFDAWKGRAQFRRLVGRATFTDRLLLWALESRWEVKPRLPETIPDRPGNVVKRRDVGPSGAPKSGYQPPIGTGSLGESA